jgi:hypothetical protein
MYEQALLLCQVIEQKKEKYLVECRLIDDTPFQIEVRRLDAILIENSKPQKAWLRVISSGEIDRKVSIELPVPHHVYGARVNVSTSHIKTISEYETQRSYDTRTADVKKKEEMQKDLSQYEKPVVATLKSGRHKKKVEVKKAEKKKETEE